MPYITLPVVDLTAEPKKASADFSHDDLRLTQLLYGEELKIEKCEGDWLYISAVEQNGYLGWIPKSAVNQKDREIASHVVCALTTTLDNTLISYATYLTEDEAKRVNPQTIRPIPKAFDPHLLVKDAHLFIGAPYLWGGRSAPLPGKAASVDCSGFINLLYRAQGQLIPRDAHDQSIAAIDAPLLKGSVIYLRKKERNNHVVIYLSENTCIESPETGRCVQISSLNWDNDKVHIENREGAYFSVKMFARRERNLSNALV